MCKYFRSENASFLIRSYFSEMYLFVIILKMTMASCGTKDGFTLFGDKVITEVELLPASIFTDSAIDFVKMMINAKAVFRCVSQ